METRAVDQIVWRQDLYPRFEPDPATIQRYAESIDRLPPIWVNQRDELIDGYHRWTAHKKAGLDEVPVEVKPTESDAALLRMAIETNAAHGLQLSMDDKRRLALKLYDGDKSELARMLSVTERTIRSWVESIDRSLKEERERRIRDLWLSCSTQDEIAVDVGLDQSAIARTTQELCDLESFPNRIVLAAQYQDQDWTPPLYNIWSFAKNTNSTTHFGNSAQEIVDRLLYLYTEPFDIVVDPFAGGGSTIDICKRRLRRYWVSDRLPIPERRDIRQADIADGPPSLHKRWSDVSLLYLDPPYWRQARNQYSSDPTDLANMPIGDFYAALTGFVHQCAAKMRDQSHIALLIQPTQWLADQRQMVDHVFDLVRLLDAPHLRYEMRVICPYSSEQYNAQQVQWAKDNRQVLVLNRELIIWRVQR
jgi:ParB-like chromosome segregation protein Spo0J